MAGACPTEPRARVPPFAYLDQERLRRPRRAQKKAEFCAVDAGLRNRATLGGKRLVFTLQAQDKECVAGPMIDPLTNSLFQVSMHYKTDWLAKSGDGAWSAAPTVEDRAGPSSPSGPQARRLVQQVRSYDGGTR